MAEMQLSKANTKHFYEDMAKRTAIDINDEAKAFQIYLAEIKQLWNRYDIINANANYFNSQFKKVPKDGLLSPELQNLLKKGARTKLVKLLNEIEQWIKQSYILSMKLRKLITKQEFFYYVLNTGASISFKLNEEQFVQLLTKGMSFHDKLTNSDKVIKSSEQYLSKLRMKVDTRLTSLKSLAGKDNYANLKKDALYDYLSTDPYKKLIKAHQQEENPSLLYPSRRYELYTQLLYSMEWKKTNHQEVVYKKEIPIKEYFFTEERQNAVDEFYFNYIQAKMHKDWVAFYKTGDAIIDCFRLIENKTTGGAINFITVRNLIKELAHLNLNLKTETSNKLKELFSYYDASNAFAKQIQLGAAQAATDNIDAFLLSVMK